MGKKNWIEFDKQENIYKEKPIYSAFSIYNYGSLLGSFIISIIALFIILIFCI